MSAAAVAATAKTRLRVSATPASVAPGEKIKVRITGTKARRCTLTLRADRFRANPYLRKRIGRRSTLTLSARSTPGARILAVRCGNAQAFTSILIEGAGGFDTGIDPPVGPGTETGIDPGMDPPFDIGIDPGFDPATGPGCEPFCEEPIVEIPPPPPVTDAPPDTTPPSTPTGLSRAASTTSSITLSWQAANDDTQVTGYSAFRNGTRVANVVATSYKFTGLACGKSYTLGVAAYDARGNVSATAPLVAATAACPPPPKTVKAAKGGSAQGRAGCSSAACRFLQVSFSNFSGGTHTITCRASGGDEGGFYSYTRTGTSGTSAVCYYGFPGRTVWATVDGVASNKITW